MNKKAKFLIISTIGIIIYLIITLIIPDAKYLGKGYFFLEETKIIYKPKTSYGIDPYVIDYKFNSDYIIIMQKVPKYQNIIYDQVEYPNNSDSVFFYVIEKQTDMKFGPFDSIMFNDYIKKYQVSLSF